MLLRPLRTPRHWRPRESRMSQAPRNFRCATAGLARPKTPTTQSRAPLTGPTKSILTLARPSTKAWTSSATRSCSISVSANLTVDKFLDSGFANPTIDVTVTSSDGKRVERVRMAKSNHAYVAKRENDPALYQLSARNVD